MSNQTSSKTAGILRAENVYVYYSSKIPAVAGVNLEIFKNQITAFIGPSGCGKSTILRCFNRLNDLIEGTKISCSITFGGQNLYGENVDPVAVRRHMVWCFSAPTLFRSQFLKILPLDHASMVSKGAKMT